MKPYSKNDFLAGLVYRELTYVTNAFHAPINNSVNLGIPYINRETTLEILFAVRVMVEAISF